MKVLVLGAGALGGYYGGRLMQAGADVTFLVRPARQQLLRERGLVVNSPMGNIEIEAKTILEGDVDPAYDLVLLTCKAYDLEVAAAAIAPALSDTTVVLPLLNGLAPYDMLDHLFGRQRILGGIAYIATKLLPNGDISHLSPFDRLILGARDTAQSESVGAIHDLFGRTPGDRTLSGRVDSQLCEKWVMICSGAAVTCLMRAPIGVVMGTWKGEHLIRSTITECLRVASESGFTLSTEAIRGIESSLLDGNSKWAASMMRDVEANATKIEADAIVGDMIQRARRLSLETPCLGKH